MKIYLIFLWLCIDRYSFVQAEGRRPVYIIAHMVNSVYEVDEQLSRGANAIETDITFYGNGSVRQVFHGYPCDCYRVCDERENFAKYLNYIRDLANPNDIKYRKTLNLLFLDLKLGDVSRNDRYHAGEEMAKYLITHLWSNDLSDPHIHVLISIPHTSDIETIRGIRDTFIKSNRETTMQKLGFDVSMNDDLNTIRRMYTKLGVTMNRWQGDGITNCFRAFRDDNRLRHAIRIRDSDNGFIDKVYDWTLDITPQIRRTLRAGIDGIITNFPERVMSVLQEREFRDTYRIATSDDNPFSRVLIPDSPSRSGVQSSQSVQDHMASLREVAIGIVGHVWDFYKLRLRRPSTLFPILHELINRAAPIVRELDGFLKKFNG